MISKDGREGGFLMNEPRQLSIVRPTSLKFTLKGCGEAMKLHPVPILFENHETRHEIISRGLLESKRQTRTPGFKGERIEIYCSKQASKRLGSTRDQEAMGLRVSNLLTSGERWFLRRFRSVERS